MIHWRHFPALVVAVVLLNTAFQMTSWASEPAGWHTGLEVTGHDFMCGFRVSCPSSSWWSCLLCRAPVLTAQVCSSPLTQGKLVS